MNNSLRYISITHKNASIAERECYFISEEEKIILTKLICEIFPDVLGLLLLSTCNRTEVYFESKITTAEEIRDFFVKEKSEGGTTSSKRLFDCCDITEDSAKHLLDVSSGLMSSVLGDAEIIHQIKKAHQFSIAYKKMSTLLERAMQAVFKTHKRISNETHFRDGTTSLAYKALKVICDTYCKDVVRKKNILFIGAGDIVKQLFKYNSKFDFSNIYVSNRTQEKARVLAKSNRAKVYDWNKVLINDFQGIDVIISAASNCHHLIKNMPSSVDKVMAIDLAIPCNIDKKITEKENLVFYDLDSFSLEIDSNKERRLSAISKVEEIISDELLAYREWVEKASLRLLLAESKVKVNKKIKSYFEADIEELCIQSNTNQIMGQLAKQIESSMSTDKIDAIITKEVSLALNSIQ